MNSQLTCTHCHQRGQDINGCFHLIGYPDWWHKPSAGAGAAQLGGRLSDADRSSRGGRAGTAARTGGGAANRGRSSSSRGRRFPPAAGTQRPPTRMPNRANGLEWAHAAATDALEGGFNGGRTGIGNFPNLSVDEWSTL